MSIAQRPTAVFAALLVLALVAALTPSAAADDPTIDSLEPREPVPWEHADPGDGPRMVEDAWFVEFTAPPAAAGGAPAEHANERAQLATEAAEAEVDFAERGDFTTLWNGLSVEATHSAATALGQLDSVAAVYPVAEVELPEPEEADPDLFSALTMTGADHAQTELGYTGEGLSVAIIDTGIDYNHPDLGGAGAPEVVYSADGAEDRTLTGLDGEEHPRISHGWDYVGEGFDAADPDTPPPDPNPDPMDPQGHGTHVAGIAGADAAEEDGATGVAPGVTFGAYKVFDVGSTTSEIILAALEDAYVDGMDIVNMSLGASLAWGQEYPTTAASNELAAQGVAVVNSAGNDAALGTWSLSAPANAHDIISVASADNLEMLANVFEVDQLDEPVPWLELTGAELPPTEGESEPLALPAESEIVEDDEVVDEGYFGCEAADFDDFPEGDTALVERGHCPFATKYVNAAEADADAVVIFNNIPGLFAGTILDAGIEGVWGAGIGDADGQALAGLIEDGEEVTLGFTDQEEIVVSPTGGLLSGFSSYGQDVELGFAPSVTAPGGLITSTYPLELDEYAMLSGTSMSAPHVAGAVALLWEADGIAEDDRGDRDPLALRDRLQNTAEPSLWSLNPGLGFLDHSFRQGAGMIQIDRAIEAEQRVEPGQLALGDGAEAVTETVTLTNEGDTLVTYTLDHDPSMATGWSTFEPGFPVGFDEEADELFLFPATVDAPEEVEVPAGGSVDVQVSIVPPFGSFDVVPNHQFGGYVTFTAEDAEDLRVPYSGFDGDYLEMGLMGYWDFDEDGLPTFVDVSPQLVELAGFDEDGFALVEPVEEGHEFTIRDGDIPIVEAFWGHFPREMEVYAINQDSGDERLALSADYLPRSPLRGATWLYPWDGRTAAGASENFRSVPSGTYTLEVNVLRALGDPDNPDHWETWESPEFELDTGRGGAPAERGPGAGGPPSGDDENGDDDGDGGGDRAPGNGGPPGNAGGNR